MLYRWFGGCYPPSSLNVTSRCTGGLADAIRQVGILEYVILLIYNSVITNESLADAILQVVTLEYAILHVCDYVNTIEHPPNSIENLADAIRQVGDIGVCHPPSLSLSQHDWEFDGCHPPSSIVSLAGGCYPPSCQFENASFTSNDGDFHRMMEYGHKSIKFEIDSKTQLHSSTH